MGLMRDEIVIYEGELGGVKLDFDKEAETIWASQKQIAELFSVDVRTVNEHIKRIYRMGELEEGGTIRKIRIVQQEGNREVSHELVSYNLDAILL
jgi:hypothetical protein